MESSDSYLELWSIDGIGLDDSPYDVAKLYRVTVHARER